MQLVHLHPLDPSSLKFKDLPDEACTVEQALFDAGWTFQVPTVVVKRTLEGKEIAVPRSERAQTWLEKDDSLICVQLPAGGGGGDGAGKSVVGVVAMVALLALAAPTGGLSLIAAAGLTGTTASLASAALLIGGSLLLSTFLKPPAGSTSRKKQKTISDFAAGSNQARLFEPVPVIYGQYRTQPPYGAPPYIEYENNEQYVYQLFCLGAGEYDVTRLDVSDTAFWFSSTGLEEGFEDFEVEVYAPNATVTLFPFNVQTSAEVSGIQIVTTAPAGPFRANAAGTVAIGLAVDFIFPRGLGEVEDDGNLIDYSVAVVAEYQELDEFGAGVGGWITLFNEIFTRETRQPLRFTRKAAVPPGEYRVRLARSPAGQEDSSFHDDLIWVGLRAYIEGPQSFPDVTMIAVKVRATENAAVSSGQVISALATRKILVWNGSSWVLEASRKRSWIAADILRDTVYGAGLLDSRIPVAKLTSLQTTWDALGDVCDIVFDSAVTVWDALHDVLRAGRAYPLMIAGRVDVVRDEPQTMRRFLFTDRNIVRGSLSANYIFATDDTPDDFIVEFIDNLTWRPSEVRATLPASSSLKPTRIQERGVTDRLLAWRLGMFLAADNKYRRRFYNFTTEWDGRLLKRGDPGRIVTDLMDAEVASIGVVVSSASGILEADHDLDWGGSNYVRLRDRLGRDWGPIQVTQGASVRHAVLDSSDLADIETQTGQSLAEVLAGSDQERTPLVFLNGVSTVREVKVMNIVPQDGDLINVFVVEDDPNVYLADGTGSVPGLPDPPPIPYVPTIPVISGLSAYRIQVDVSVQLYASWLPAPGATSYVAQISYDAGTSWGTVYVGARAEFTAQVESPEAHFRVAGVGTVQGPWTEAILPAIVIVFPVPTDFDAYVEALVDQLFADSDFAGTVESVWNELLLQVDLSALDDVEDMVEGYLVDDDQSTQYKEYTKQVAERVVAEGVARAEAVQILHTEITAEGEARALAVTALQASVGEVEASVVTEQLARADADSALSSSITSVNSRVDTAEANIATVSATEASHHATQATQITSLTGRIGTAEANIINASNLEATHHSAQAVQLTSLTASVGGNTASIGTLQSAVSGPGGLTSQFVLRGTINGNTGGFVFSAAQRADGSAAFAIEFEVDAFRISKPGVNGGAPTPVFALATIDGVTKLGLRGDMIVDGTIIARTIQAGAVITDKVGLSAITDVLAASGVSFLITGGTAGSRLESTMVLTPTEQIGAGDRVITVTAMAQLPGSGDAGSAEVLLYRRIQGGVLSLIARTGNVSIENLQTIPTCFSLTYVDGNRPQENVSYEATILYALLTRAVILRTPFMSISNLKR